MTDTTDIAALKINTYSVNSNDAWPQCTDDDRTGSYVKWEDVVNLLSVQRQGNVPETGFDSLKNLKFVADCCIENPDSIYASEFFLLLDEMFCKQGDYSMPVQAVAVSHLIWLLEAERQRAGALQAERDEFRRRLKLERSILEDADKELAALKGEQVPVYQMRLLDGSQLQSEWVEVTEQEYKTPVKNPSEWEWRMLFTAPQKPVVLPEINEDLVEIIGRPNFTCSGLAELLRRNGADIKRKSENEQAYVIHWLLGIYLKHGIEWRAIAESELKSMAAKAAAGGIVKDGE